MSPALLIVLTAMAVAVLVPAISLASPAAEDPIDPEVEKRRMVRWIARHPRLAAFVERRLDRTRVGGLMLTLGFIAILALGAVWGAVFDMVDEGYGFARFDSAVAEYGAANAESAWVPFYRMVTHLGGSWFVTLLATVVGVWGWRRYGSLHIAAFVFTAVVGQALLNSGLKALVDRERPDLAQLTSYSASSFPSGHAAAAAATLPAVALVLTLRSRRRRRALAAGIAGALAAAVAATRALLGVHWFTDVIAGSAVGFIWFLVVAIAFGGRLMAFGAVRDEVAVSDPEGDPT